jgi:DNA-directed RNA polymerase specialized sigma24 family protein
MDRLSEEKQREAWELTQAAFARLLSWLDEGNDSGGQRYLEMRRRLHTWFDRKACPNPEMLADETLNRVARRLAQTGKITGATPAQYCYITAKYVWLESLRQPQHAPIEEAELPKRLVPQADVQARESKFICLETCLACLTEAERALLLRYFAGTERTKMAQRQALAAELGLSANALSLRVFRLRARLEQCVKECLAQNE